MAYVKIGQIKSTPARAIKYITRPDATNDGLLVSTNAAVIDPSDWSAIASAMGETTRRVGKTEPREGSVLAHHVIQSFDPSEPVDSETAHRIGEQLAEQITGGAHEYVVATHLDKGHVHNHIIFNAVNMETGLKFRAQRNTLAGIRDRSDELCRSAGLSVMPPAKRTGAPMLAEVYATIKGDSHKHFLRTEIDKAAGAAVTWQDFEAALQRAGIETNRRSGTLAFRDESRSRTIRDWRLGEAYQEDAIMARINRALTNRIDVDQSMIVRESAGKMTVRVPGTRGGRHLTVDTNHVVQHGRTMRVYLPSAADHVLATKQGTYAETVSTEGLYAYFSRPKLNEAREVRGRYAAALHGGVKDADMSRWGASLTVLRQMQDRVNAQSRWLSGGSDVQDALTKARVELATTRASFQTQLVALADAASDPDSDRRTTDVIAAQLRTMERTIDKLKRDVNVLDAMEEPPRKDRPLNERIQNRARAQQTQEQRRERQRQLDARGTEEAVKDFKGDREIGDGDGNDMQVNPTRSLADRIKARAAKQQPHRPDDDNDRGARRH